jgi:alkanesulfonate monooxygenase SsuD/methylene tetrahydromethanopterin reductase-like flavin-dependent oxidoreductase (luciferase family)
MPTGGRTPRTLHLGVALDGAGAHPAAWRAAGTALGLTGAERLVGLARTAERGRLDFVSLDDAYDPPAAGSAQLPLRLDALLALASVAPATTSIGLVPTVTTTHTEPFHVSKNIATLDLVSAGRAGWRVAVSTSTAAARRFGRKDPKPIAELYEEAEDAVEVVSRLWDSWEDDAVIRDVASGRYVDRDKLHYIDFHGRFFDVRGPSITPRSPQAQPLVVVDATVAPAVDLAGRRADIALIRAAAPAEARARRQRLRELAARAGRDPEGLAVLVIARIGEPGRRGALDALVGGAPAGRPEAELDLVGAPAVVAGVLEAWFVDGAADGFLLRPDVLPDTLDWFVEEVAGILQARSRFRTEYEGATLRDRFGLERPANRYQTARHENAKVPR